MKVPLLDLRAQLKSLEPRMTAAIREVVESTRYIGGPNVEALERDVADYVGAGSAVGVSSGTDALLISLMALEVGPDDLVLTSPYSFFATAGAVARVGARPVFVDIDPETYNLDPRAVRDWFERNAGLADRVKAIVPVHLYGQCADMASIVDLAQERRIPIIEDAAQAIGARYPTREGLSAAGSIGTLGCFSFFPSKNLGCMGDGGMVVTDDADLADRLRRLRNHGAAPKYHHALIGGNFRLDAIQAAVLRVKLPHLDRWHEMRRRNAEYYDEGFAGGDVTTPVAAWGRERHIYNQYVISVPDRRDALREFLSDHEIATEVYYPVAFHEQECFRYLDYRRGEFPHSEHAARHTLALPIYPELTRQMQDHVIERIGAFHA